MEKTVTFTAEGDKTHVMMHIVFPSAEARDYVVGKYGAVEGAQQTFERLAEYLPQIAPVTEGLKMNAGAEGI